MSNGNGSPSTYCNICNKSVTNSNFARHYSAHPPPPLSEQVLSGLGNGSASEVAHNLALHGMSTYLPATAPYIEHPGAPIIFRKPRGVYYFFKWLVLISVGIYFVV